ncbi:hypothetical protein CEF21_04140 [Bacillus sp. FJAT-42376]|nr:hypothetical protein CEF21_04140 [Bacillus sp. FJAT-42376]
MIIYVYAYIIRHTYMLTGRKQAVLLNLFLLLQKMFQRKGTTGSVYGTTNKKDGLWGEFSA